MSRRLYLALLNANLLLPLAAQTPSLTIDHDAGPARLGLSGTPGRTYVIEAASSLADPNGWESLATARLTNASTSWFDSASGASSVRFYRATQLSPATQPVTASNFRLIDHTGRSRELYYHHSDPAIHAMVLVFTGNGCPKVHELIATLKTLRNQFGPQGVHFWMIDSNAGDNRSNIVAEATAQGIDLPILHDAAQLTAREYGATTTPECFALKKSSFDWTVFYHGAIDDRTGPAPGATTQHYLSDALTAHLANQPVIISQAKAYGCVVTLNPPTTPAYAADIAPLLQQKCVRCHSPGNIGPFAMTNYAVVQAYASNIKHEVLEGHMPPWHVDPFYGQFANDFSLAPAEAARLVEWINDGAPRGSGPDPLASVGAPPTNYPFVLPAALGTPDAVVSIPLQSIPASGVLAYRNFTVTSPFASDVWLRAAIVLPGNITVVHHCLVFEGGGLMGLDGFFAGYVPGYEAAEFPAGTGKLLRQGASLNFQMHYITTGQAATDQTRLALYLSPAPPQYALQTKSAFSVPFVFGQTTIPAGASDFEISGQYPVPGLSGSALPKDILLYEMSPHMHLRGSRFRYEAVHLDGSREVLLSVPHYEFHWQTLYRLAQPKRIPAGSRIVCVGAWDNSAQNPWNPDPTSTVAWGDQTFNEMFIGYFNFVELP